LFISCNKIKGWFNSIYGNYKYSNKEVYCKVYNKPKEAFWILILLLIKEITTYSNCITRVLVLYISVDTQKKHRIYIYYILCKGFLSPRPFQIIRYSILIDSLE